MLLTMILILMISGLIWIYKSDKSGKLDNKIIRTLRWILFVPAGITISIFSGSFMFYLIDVLNPSKLPFMPAHILGFLIPSIMILVLYISSYVIIPQKKNKILISAIMTLIIFFKISATVILAVY